jgi:DNA/RNA endonuclease G (NUC1)
MAESQPPAREQKPNEIAKQAERPGADAVTVPIGFWKVIVDQARGEAIAFIMPQKPIAKGDLTPFEMSIGAVEAAGGMRLPLPAAVDRASVPALWNSDLKAWRKMHRQKCAGAD